MKRDGTIFFHVIYWMNTERIRYVPELRVLGKGEIQTNGDRKNHKSKTLKGLKRKRKYPHSYWLS